MITTDCCCSPPCSASGSASRLATRTYVNVVGGLKLEEPAADLSVAVAIASSAANRAVRAGTVHIGEVGLSGELRSVSQIERRLSEAAKLGFSRVVCSRTNRRRLVPDGFEVVQVATLAEAVALSLEAPRPVGTY
ncbi:MAG: magnesium chelatase domain-containing protein [Chloroflexia bacterium]